MMVMLMISLVPRPVVMVSATESVLVSGSPLYLVFYIQSNSSVTTPAYATFSWNAPNSIHDTVDTVTDASVLMISSVMTADSGDYIYYSVTLTDSSDSMYIIDSEPATANVSIIVSK